ncbi:DsbA family oxidoreductase [Salinibacillus xinjiangensis]|uniref:Thioredoxin domain-containing protein n=1 Tax=Salinibacillus xinjiangensis TaxID=1229268 RepID=A0A6G1XAG9_9BACI|nr:DsbA family oxidoreductase [Salinibacillus xinjiangensis]MRG87905.1 thioredoxin domain-containing protein [Salinibacillus xinjiangensis]
MGKRRLEGAIQKIGHPVEVTYRSFELDPTMERDVKENMYEKLANKYGMSIEQAKANTESMVEMAKEAGLDYHLDTLILTNTFDAHRLALFAKEQGLMTEMTERILHAYFTESKHIGDHRTLTELAVEVGLNREAVEKMLASEDMKEEVLADERQAREYGINGVPFFLINKKYALSGAQPTETFVQALQKVLAEEQT